MASYKDYFTKQMKRDWKAQPKRVFKIVPNAVRRVWNLAARLNKINNRGKEHH